ncbi:MAG: OB-fold nucleic acid binding domain-containing protein, partial [Candidatus Helarchaeales archaeon]
MKIKDILSGDFTEKQVQLRGWVYRTRGTKKMHFIILRDSTGILQLTIIKSETP